MSISYRVNYWLVWARNMRVPLRAMSVQLRVIPAGFQAHSNTAWFLVCRIVAASCAVPTDELYCPRG